jgi:histidyl-tRNA synthetase
VLTALIRQSLGALSEQSLGEALIIIDKLAKIGPEQVVTLLAALDGSSRSGAEKLIALLHSDAQHTTPIEPVRTALLGAPSALAELEQLEATLALVNSALGKSGSTVTLNLAIARGLGYYTGLVFETILNAKPDWGSICSGGRYNHLIDRFVHQEVPGVGGSIGLDRLVAALMANQENTDQRTDAVFIAVASSDAYAWGFQLAQHLRAEQIPCEIALKEQKLGHQFKYANRHGYPLVITVGGEEVQARTATVKVMDTGHEEKHIPWQQLAARIKEYRHGIANHQRSPGSNP